MNKLCQYVDVCISNEEDANDVFGIKAPNTDVTAGEINSEGYKYVADELKKRFTNVTSIGVEKENYISPLEESQERHITEHDLDNYDNYDYKIINSTKEKLEEEISKILEVI